MKTPAVEVRSVPREKARGGATYGDQMGTVRVDTLRGDES